MIRVAHRMAVVAAAGAATLALGACSDTVLIKYDQVVDCPIFDENPTASPDNQKRAGGIFLFYNITEIQNTGANASDFKFDLNKIYIDDKAHKPDSTIAYKLIGTSPYVGAKNQTVKKGESKSPVGFIAIDEPISGPQDKFLTANLRYDNSAGESILMVNDSIGKKPLYTTSCTPSYLGSLIKK